MMRAPVDVDEVGHAAAQNAIQQIPDRAAENQRQREDGPHEPGKPVLLAGRSLPPAEVTNIVTGRCAMCHAPEPSWPGIQIAPKGVLLDGPEQIAMHARAIRTQAVMTHAMPPNNLSGMTAGERRVLAAWLAETPR